MPLIRCFAHVLSLFALVALALPLDAATVNINPSEDTTLSNFDPNNNFGASHHLMAGGLLRNPRPTRMLTRFDIAGSIPAGSTINSATLSIIVTRTPNGSANSTFQLRRINNAWIEGTGGSTSVPDRGSVASGGSISWNSPFPGGGTVGTHYSSTISSDLAMTGNGTHTFTTRPQLAADIQDMLDNAANNFGWAILSQNENGSKTVRRIGSSENPSSKPVLVVDFDAPPVPPITVDLPAIADTSLFENNPNNNLGAMEFVPIGTILSGEATSRGLFKFDLTAIPPGAVAQSATLGLTIVFLPNASGEIDYRAHRVLTEWNEGTGVTFINGSGSLGDPALAGESSWNNSMAPSTSWGSPGGAAGTDYVSVASGIVGASATGLFEFSSQGIVDDVNQWLSNPSSNFGWMVRLADEETPFTARRIGSRQSPMTGEHPNLTVTWDFPGPVIKNVQRVNGTIQFEFEAFPLKTYAVERRRAFGIGGFVELESFPAASTNRLIQVSYPITALSPLFYRVRTP